MGFKRGALILEWPEDSEFSGLVIRMKRMTIRQLIDVEKLGDVGKDSTAAEVKEAMSEMLDAVAGGLLSWNYETEDGTPVPAVRESLDELDMEMVMAWIRAWKSAAAAVPLASPPSSPTGAPEPPDEEWASFLATSQESSAAPVSS
jgi:hypothetical protein